MKKVLILLFFATNVMLSQPFEIGRVTMSFFDSSRNRSITTEIFYPADSNGALVPVTIATTESFPLLSFGHGFVMGFDAYQNFWEALVPQGYIIAFPKTESSITPSHTNFAKDLAFVIESMNIQNTLSNSLFFNRVSSKNAVMGHSMGGGCALLSKQYSGQINHVVTFAAAETNPSAILASAAISLPTFTIAGKNDCVSPPITNQLLIYNALNSNCKNYLEIFGASHCQMANSNFLCSFGEASCSPSTTISRETQHEIIFSYLSLWLDFYLKENCLSGQLFETLKANDETNDFESNCVLCEPLTISSNNFKEEIIIGPNPFSDEIFIQSKNNIDFGFKIFDNTGKIIMVQDNYKEYKLNTTSFSEGIYLILIYQNTSTSTFKLIKY